MKIIKRGKLKIDEVVHHCRKCDTAFSYSRKDEIIDNREGNYILCPLCGAFISSAFNR